MLAGFRGTDLRGRWTLTLTETNAAACPSAISGDLEPVPAAAPGTVAAALEAAGRFDRNDPVSLIDQDAWYRRPFDKSEAGAATLRFEGLATIADVFLDDRLILATKSMFERHDVNVEINGDETLSICFRALRPHLDKKGPRARWRPRLMNNQGLRLLRTTALGFMPGWYPEIHAVGPWRPVMLLPRPPGESAGKPSAADIDVTVTLDADGTGRLLATVKADCSDRDMSGIVLRCDDYEAGFTWNGEQYRAELMIPNVKPWWPHTHGEPALYDVTLTVDGMSHMLARTGFRHVTIDRGQDGKDFLLAINGEPIFCRGAVWTCADPASLSGTRETYAPWLIRARDAGMNMIRVPGIALYESPDFFALCDELGLMVWQDFIFANFDYPAEDPDFMIHVKSEIERFLSDTATSPSLTILCGGSEILQQGAMLGLPERIWNGPFCNDVLRDLASASRPDLPYVVNAPSGGAQPFFPGEGIAHYYGVGAYRRPLDDARRANIRFAAECLAFSNLAADETLGLGKTGIPRDAGADWDFEDVRDHYLGVLYGVDPVELRRQDMPRYLALSRAVTGEVMTDAFAEWRRPGSTCHGALVFTLQDVMKGPGWGVVTADGKPKPAWHALRRSFRSKQILLSDEGTNGLDIHVLNETPQPIAAVVELLCLRDGKTPVVSGRRKIELQARDTITIAATDLIGAFFDTTYAYRFGPPSHDVTVARLRDAISGDLIAEAFHFPLGRAEALHPATMCAELLDIDGSFHLELTTDCFAQSITIDAGETIADDNGFHLSPGAPRRIRLSSPAGTRPSGTIQSLGSGEYVRF
ncbi:MAG: glycoside hydrolase family 2 protein [Neorhizobium sp.]|nr:glycoside hydrolase family 2 protein [Neorhizobium sp.]